MSGSRGNASAIAQLRARQVPAHQIPMQVGPIDFRYPMFGGPPVTPPAVPAAAVGAAPRVVAASPAAVAAPALRYSGENLSAAPAQQQAQQPAAAWTGYQGSSDSPDAGASPTGWGGPGTATAGPDQPGSKPGVGPDPSLGPAPGVMNSLSDVARVGQTLANFGLAAVTANPIGMARAVVNSPVGMGLIKNASAAFGISRATPAPDDLSTLSKPEPDEGRSALGTLASIAGFGGPAATRGGAKAEKGPDEVTAEAGPKGAPATAAPPTAATVTADPAPAPAPAPAAPPAETAPSDPSGLDFGGLGSPSEGGDMGNGPSPGGQDQGGNLGGAGSDYGGSLNDDPGSTQDSGTAGLGSTASESQGGQADGGGKGDSAGDGSNGESGAGSSDGGQKRMGGPIDSNGDGRLSAVPITAHEGEFVMSPEAVAMVGPDILQRINDMALDAAGHPPRPINPQAMVQSPLSQLRAGAVSPRPGSPGAGLLAQPGQQSPSIYRGPMPMPGYGGAPIPVPQAPPAVPSPLAMVTTVAAPSGGPALPGPPPGPFPMPPTTPMGVAEGFSENAVPFTEQGQRPMVGPPPPPPAAAARAAAPRAGGGGGLTTDQLNGMSLDLARGGANPPPGGAAREAYDRIAGRMQDAGKPAYRMGGMVQPVAGTPPLAGNEAEHYADMPWGQYLPHALHEPPPMIMFGYDPNRPPGPEGPMEFGPDDLRRRFDPTQATPAFRMGGQVEGPEDYSEGDAYEDAAEMESPQHGSPFPSSASPYADEANKDQLFGDDPSAPPGGGMDDVQQRLMALPPEMQQAVAAAIGSNPMVASALLAVLGPHFAPLIQAAIGTASPPRPDPLAALMGGGGGPPMQPIG